MFHNRNRLEAVSRHACTFFSHGDIHFNSMRTGIAELRPRSNKRFEINSKICQTIYLEDRYLDNLYFTVDNSLVPTCLQNDCILGLL